MVPQVIENTLRDIQDAGMRRVVRDAAFRAGQESGTTATDLLVARVTSNDLMIRMARKNRRIADKYRAAISTLEANIAMINGGKRMTFNWER